MERLKSFGLFLLGLAIVVLVAAGIWLLLKSLFSNASVAGPVVAASVAIIVFAGGEYFTRQRIAQQYRWDKVADTYAKFLDEAGLDSNTQATMLQRDLLCAIRKDLGQFDRKLDDRDLMKLLVNDIDEHFDPGLVPKK